MNLPKSNAIVAYNGNIGTSTSERPEDAIVEILILWTDRMTHLLRKLDDQVGDRYELVRDPFRLPQDP